MVGARDENVRRTPVGGIAARPPAVATDRAAATEEALRARALQAEAREEVTASELEQWRSSGRE